MVKVFIYVDSEAILSNGIFWLLNVLHSYFIAYLQSEAIKEIIILYEGNLISLCANHKEIELNRSAFS